MMRRHKPEDHGDNHNTDTILIEDSPRMHINPINQRQNMTLALTMCLLLAVSVCVLFVQFPSPLPPNPLPSKAFLDITPSSLSHTENLTFSSNGGTLLPLLEQKYSTLTNREWEGFIMNNEAQEIRQLNVSEEDFVYGEILPASVDYLVYQIVGRESLTVVSENNSTIRYMEDPSLVKSRRVFYDIGASVGKAAIHVFLSNFFQRATGVEISRSRFSRACTALEVISNTPEVLDTLDRGHELSFIRSAFQEKGVLFDVSSVYAATTCFSDKLMTELLQLLDSIPRGVLLGTLQHPYGLVEGTGFTFTRDINTPSSWSEETETHLFITPDKSEKDGDKDRTAIEKWDGIIKAQPEYCRLIANGRESEFVWKKLDGIDYRSLVEQ